MAKIVERVGQPLEESVDSAAAFQKRLLFGNSGDLDIFCRRRNLLDEICYLAGVAVVNSDPVRA